MARNDAEFSTRVFAASGAAFAVTCPSAAIRDAIEVLFIDLRNGREAGHVTEMLIIADDSGLTLNIGERFVAGPASLTTILTRLITEVSLLALDADPDQLHLHCAALSHSGRGVLVVAPSGTGKTMTAAALATRGWTYVSDEAVGAQRGTTSVTGFPKPLMIKPGGFEIFPRVAEGRVVNDVDNSHLQVPVSRLGAAIAPELEPSLLVFLHRALDGSTDAPPAGSTLHPADAVVEMMGQTMDAQRFGRDAVEVLSRLAARTLCVTVQVGPLDQLAALIEVLIHEPAEVLEVEILESVDMGGEWQIPDAVHSVAVGDRALVHDTDGGAIAALDEAGTAVWRALHGDTPRWWQDDTMQDPAICAFLEQLKSHGLVAHAAADRSAGQ